MGKNFYVIGLILFFICNSSFAQTEEDEIKGPVATRAQKENELENNNFAVTYYKPTYILPYYYTGSPFETIYETNGATPNNEKIQRYEVKFQLSFKVPAWKDLVRKGSTVYLAYTQLSYWQAYNHTAFFRETNYEPELYLANEINWRITKNLHINFFNIGAVHESNGHGGTLERSWNRIYIETISSYDNFMLSIRPWYIIRDGATMRYNKNIGNYLGYGEITLAYKYQSQVLALQLHSLFENGAKRFTAEFTYSFPITCYLNAYLDVFSGYGQSLIEYDHRTNSVGLGISLSNWI